MVFSYTDTGNIFESCAEESSTTCMWHQKVSSNDKDRTCEKTWMG